MARLAGASLLMLALAQGCEENSDDDFDDEEEESPATGSDASVLDAGVDASVADAGSHLDASPSADAGPDAGPDGGSDAGDGPAEFRPEPREPTDALIEQLAVADGFALNVFARDLGHARMLATHGGHVYLTRPRHGDVLRLVDANGDGVAETRVTVASALMGVHGIAFHESSVYLATPTEIHRGRVTEAGDFSALTTMVDDLPDGGQHPNRTMGVGPDGLLYVSVGSSCNACEESNPEHATMLRLQLDGSGRTIFARGLRNTIGFGWHPDTGELWGMDHGSDWRGDDTPPEELNLLRAGAHYGWPYCHGDRNIDTIIADPPDTTKEAFCAMTEGPTLTWTAHAAPIAFTFYTADSFPAEYRGSAFVALRGSWNRSVPAGYKIVRLVFEDGSPARFEDFVAGFLIENGRAQFGRLAGLTVAPDGALLFTDDENGYVYRVQTAP